MSPLPAALVFGPQTSLPSADLAVQLRAALLIDPRLYSLRASIENLPSVWPVLLAADPALGRLPSHEALQQLSRWLSDGHFPKVESISELPAVFVTPFTVILQLVQYLCYADPRTGGPAHEDVLKSVKDQGGVQGFCTGLLSAVSVATSGDVESICRQAAAVLRLAVAIGAYIDLDCAESTDSSSVAVKSRQSITQDQLEGYLVHFPDTYVSVVMESSAFTVTTPAASLETVSNKLKSQGLAVKQVDLRGRFHYPGHARAAETLRRLAASNTDFQLPQTSSLLAPVYSNIDGQRVPDGSIHDTLLDAMLVQQCQWYASLAAAFSHIPLGKESIVVQLGLVDCVLSAILRLVGASLQRIWRISQLVGHLSATVDRPADSPYHPSSEPIAIVGMACKFPGADTLDEFWQLLSDGTSMCRTMPEQRFKTTGLRRSPDDKLKYWGNFVNDIDAFDHRFFKKSSREAGSMDPQQRLLLEVAYQALESAEYSGLAGVSAKRDVGCYLGVCASDYNDNVASHQPNAFSSLGTLRAFLSGKISHFFGWTGPSITYDTACSSSAVAIQAACKALQSGECSMALAGGVSLYTSPNFYQNLAAASFLSPTGPTKPFDAKGDGYCRGEGVGVVLLKKLPEAISAGDNIMAVIAAAAVNQNKNTTAITVPHSDSQIELYEKVVADSGLHPHDVSFVEAHGTGTPVGDPIEFASIRKVFGGADRAEPLAIASVKGNIGHLEGASGAAALIKTVLMMRHGVLPVQANHSQLNAKIAPLEDDRIMIPLATQPWRAKYKAACINNYGAAGSNAAMIVCEAPRPKVLLETSTSNSVSTRYPIYLSANSTASLKAYAARLLKILDANAAKEFLSSLAFHLANRQNRSLPHALITAVSSEQALREQLSMLAQDSSNLVQNVPQAERPVVLVFGGQTSTFVGLSRTVYESSGLLRAHLQDCDDALQSAGLKGIFPAIFQTEPVADVVVLHSALFSLQYACAKSWIDAGLFPAAVIGHSFGQLTALAVSGVLSLRGGLKLVTERARLMQEAWGPERGSMVSIQADTSSIDRFIQAMNSQTPDDELEVACYNGPTSHVVVGSAKAIDRLVERLAHESIRHKRLDVTHGFHSKFTEPLLPGLEQCARQLAFRNATIPIETCSENSSWAVFNASMIVQHTRTPVYFSQAVSRLAARLGTCTWLEAGSSSSVTGMVRSALESPSTHLFQPVRLGDDTDAMGALAETTTNLWRAGHKVQHWPFHRSERGRYSSIELPPYQFEKTRHWLEWKDTASKPAEAAHTRTSGKEEASVEFLTFVRYRDGEKKQKAEFRVSTQHEEYLFFVKGHAVVAEPLCPAPLYVELACQAATVLSSSSEDASILTPSVEDLDIQAPLGASNRTISLRLQKSDTSTSVWTFSFSSTASDATPSVEEQLHATGTVILRLDDSKTSAEFSRFSRMVANTKYREMMSANPHSQILQGPVVYQLFSRVVTYADYYKGVQSVQSSGHEVTARIQLPESDSNRSLETRRPLLVDNFIQTSGIHVNCLSGVANNEVYVCTKVDRVQFSSSFAEKAADMSASWTVYSSSQPISDKEVVNDIFVFHAGTGELAFFILGAHFTRVLISSLVRVLARANSSSPAPANSVSQKAERIQRVAVPVPQSAGTAAPIAKRPSTSTAAGAISAITSKLKKTLSRVIEVSVADLHDGDQLADLGVDSLLGTEVLNEINQAFDVSLPPDEFAALTDISFIVQALVSQLGVQSGGGDDIDEGYKSTNSVSDSEDSDSGIMAGVATSVLTTPDDSTGRLADLLAAHLECDVTSITANSNLADLGLDSLLAMELANDIKKMFSSEIDMAQLTNDSSFSDLVRLVLPNLSQPGELLSSPPLSSQTAGTVFPYVVTAQDDLSHAQQAFEHVRFDYDVYTKQTGFNDFWKKVYPAQARLVLAYTVEAFAQLGCNLAQMKPGERLGPIEFLPKHQLLVDQLYNIVRDGMLVAAGESGLVRTDKPVDSTPASQLLGDLIAKAPQHRSEHKLLNITGSRLGDCLTGDADPLNLLFRSKENRDLLAEVYLNGPMYAAISRLLCSFLGNVFSKRPSSGKFQILELGGGTGGTTGHLVDYLVRCGIPFTYTFSDVSASFVAAGKKKFAGRSYMEFQVIDIEKEPIETLAGRFHAIISTNCIHATRNLEISTRNIHKMLRPDGFTALVEFTRNMYWFDLVFGLLEGWWLFEDGRPHVIASERFWDSSMRGAGFQHVSWTDGESLEARTLRIIAGFRSPVADPAFTPSQETRDSETTVETLFYKQADDKIPLFADVYYPPSVSDTPRPVALMIHGGGHVMLSRKDIRPKQTAYLHSLGFLPVSVDYRLCPETTLREGPMADVVDSLEWARSTLSSLPLLCPGLALDVSRIVVVGWSTGGHLAMTTAFTSLQRGLQPPTAILAFYCPTDYEDPVWSLPNYPENTASYSQRQYNLLEAVQKKPITAYNPPASARAVGGWMAPEDPRSRIVLHMNWKGQCLPILLRGLPANDSVSPSEAQALVSQPLPLPEEVQSISPLAQIKKGLYRSPTYLVHPMDDDLIPWSQSVRTADALKEKGVRAEVSVLPGKVHLFDLYRDVDGSSWEAVRRGYDFLASEVFDV